MFHALMKDVIDGIATFGGFSLQCVRGDSRTHLFIRFWQQDNPRSLCLGTFDRHAVFPMGHLTSLSGLFSCFLENISAVSVIGYPPHFGKSLDHFSGSKNSTTNVPTFDFDDLCTLLRTPTSSVFGKADLFRLVDYLLIKMRHAMSEPWVQNSTHLRIVRCF